MGHFKVNQQVTVTGNTDIYHFLPIGTKGVVVDVADSLTKVKDGDTYQWIGYVDLRHTFKNYVLCLE